MTKQSKNDRQTREPVNISIDRKLYVRLSHFAFDKNQYKVDLAEKYIKQGLDRDGAPK